MRLVHQSAEPWGAQVELCKLMKLFEHSSIYSLVHAFGLGYYAFSYENRHNLLCKAAYAELKANTDSEVTPKYCEIMLLECGWYCNGHILVLSQASLESSGSKALKSSIASVSKYGGATAGYRTMLDALIPASQVLEEVTKCFFHS